MATLQELQSSLTNIQKLASLAQAQNTADKAAGTKLEFQPGTAIPISQPTPVMSQPTAPQATASVASVPQTDVSSYEKALMDAMKPSAEMEGLNNEDIALQNKLRMLNQGQTGVNNELADQPIAKGFITGQQASVDRRYALERGTVEAQRQTLQQRLAAAQARQQGAIAVSKFQLERMDAQRAREDAQKAALAPSSSSELRTVSGVGVVSINPDGTYKVVVPEGGRTSSTSTRSTSTAPSSSTTPSNPTSSISQTTRSVLDGLTSLSKLTPTVRTTVTNELSKLGFASNTVPDWFRKIAEEERLAQAQSVGVDASKYPLTTEMLQRSWDLYRQRIFGTTTTSTSNRTP